MRRSTSCVLFVSVLLGMLMVGGAASADPKTGCPAGIWEELTVEVVAATVWPELLDQSPWTSQQDFQESTVRPFDRNGDGLICLKTQWGEDLNPNSHYYIVGVEILGSPTQLFLPRDNNANASNNQA